MEKKSEYKSKTRICTIFVFVSGFVAMWAALEKDLGGVITNVIAFALWSYLLYFVYPPKD